MLELLRRVHKVILHTRDVFEIWEVPVIGLHNTVSVELASTLILSSPTNESKSAGIRTLPSATVATDT